MPEVRTRLVALQRALAEGPDNVVVEGRDIGTVVSPDSPLKVFLTASEEVRAERRAGQTGGDAEEILLSQRERDRRDTEREHGALKAADDAVEIDTSGLSLDEVVEKIAALARERDLT